MKKLFILTSLISMSVAQGAVETVKYDSNALDLLHTITEYCGGEFSKAVKAYHRPGSGTYQFDQNSGRRLYTIQLIQGGGWAFPAYNSGKLTLKLTPKPMDPPIADAPTVYRVECSLKLKK